MTTGLFNYGATTPPPAGEAGPDAAPFRPRAIDPDTLTMEQRHAMRLAIRSGSQQQYQAFVDGLNQNISAAAEASAQPRGGSPSTGVAVDPSNPAEALVPRSPDSPDSPERMALAQSLAEHGSDIQAIDTLLPLIDRFYDRLTVLPEDEARALVANGEQNVIARLFRGDEGAYELAMREIGDAARAVGGKALVDALADSGALLDPELFFKIQCLANAIRAGKEKRP